jgi:hypothetical protein
MVQSADSIRRAAGRLAGYIVMLGGWAPNPLGRLHTRIGLQEAVRGAIAEEAT